MTSRRVVQFKEVQAMLKICAPEAVVAEKPHHYWITYKGKTYPSLPKGEHGSGSRAEIQIGKVRHMIRDLGISEECAFAQLGLPIKAKEENRPVAPPQSKTPATHP